MTPLTREQVEQLKQRLFLNPSVFLENVTAIKLCEDWLRMHDGLAEMTRFADPIGRYAKLALGRDGG